MIVSKDVTEVMGLIEYSWEYGDHLKEVSVEVDKDIMKSDTFDSLFDLLNKMKPEVLEGIKTFHNASKAWISGISFKGISGDGKTTADISLFENKSRGHIKTEIQKEDATVITPELLNSYIKLK